jgi:hypothetical protein
MLKVIAKWFAFLLALLEFFSSLVSIPDSFTTMAYSALGGIFGLFGAVASTVIFAALMYGILKKKAWVVKAAAAAAALNSAYVIIMAFLLVPAELLEDFGTTNIQFAQQMMWTFVGASAFVNIVMAGLIYYCRAEFKD